MRIAPANNQAFTGRYLIKVPSKRDAREVEYFLNKVEVRDPEGKSPENPVYSFYIHPNEVLLLNGDDAKAYEQIFDACVLDYDSDSHKKLLNAFKANAMPIDLK